MLPFPPLSLLSPFLFHATNLPKFRIVVSMAVEARHLNLFPPQILAGREIMRPIEATAGVCLPNPYNHVHMVAAYGLPLSGTTTVDNSAGFLPICFNNNSNNNAAAISSAPIVDSLPPRTPLKSDSGLTHNYNMPLLSRKRSREVSNQILPCNAPPVHFRSSRSCAGAGSFSFLGEDISLQIEQQQLDINNLISQHTEKIRLEMEERRKNHSRRILQMVEERLVKRLRSKEEEMEKMAKMNWALEERVKSLCVENQIWRDLATTNEATANALRFNLEQVLAHVKDGDAVMAGHHDDGSDRNHQQTPLADDAESCCDSTGAEENHGLAHNEIGADTTSRGFDDRRLCRSCRREEARVLLLPCRHLCLCTVCGSSLHTCPVCNSAKTASVHVNVS